MARNVVGVVAVLAGAAWACGFDAAAAASSPAPVAASPAPAPASGELDLGPALAPIREKHHVPALAAALVEGDKVTAIGVVGVRSRSRAEPVTTEDLFHLGSCTKAMTATLIGVMVEEGTLRWDTTIAEGLPELAPAMDEGYRKVTLTQLLTHRAGVPSDLSAGELWAKLRKQEGTPVEQRDALARGVLSRPPVHAPGGEFLYSNAGFAIAGHIAEVRAGKAWEELMREKVFGPLGITTAGFGAPGASGDAGAAEKPDQPRGHRADGTPVEPGKNADNPPAIGPGGTVHMSLRDWAKFISLHVRGARGEEGLLLKAETFKVLHTPPAGTKEGAGRDYAMGWGTPEREWAGGAVLTHSGSNTLWFCVVWAAPKKNFAVLAATNTGEAAASAACDEAVQAAMKVRGAPSGGSRK